MKSTNSVKDIKEILTSFKDDVNKKLFDYQNLILNYMMRDDIRGLLLYWDVGLGKTIISVAVTEFYRKQGKEPIIITPKSLKNNFIKSIHQYYRNEKSTNQIDKIIEKYKFISSNSVNLVKDLTNGVADLDIEDVTSVYNKVIIVDEAHTIFNSISNGSKTATKFYDVIMNSRNIKILFLTGTPIVNNFFEIVPALNMCSGYINKRYTILPEAYDEFVAYFVDQKNRKLINEEKFQNRIFGLVSYIGKFYTEKHTSFKDNIKKIISKTDFPDRLPIRILKIPMSPKQNSIYLNARDKERKETKFGGSIYKEKSMLSSSYRIRSRQISNILLDGADYSNIKEYSPKINALLDIVKDKHKNNLGLIYSNFIEYGIEPVANTLKSNGFYDYNDVNKPADARCYALFTGKIDIDDRNEIVKVFNSPKNIDGSLIQLLLVSSVGEKGLNLKGIRHIHILEPNWSYTSTEQIIGRAIRYKSHEALDKENQNVQIYQYISDYNKEYIDQNNPEDKTTDVTLFYNSIKQKELNDKFLLLLAETAIDCDNFNQNINFNCYNCKSTNQILYHPDVHIDIKIPNPCKKMNLEEIVYNGDVYYFNDKKDIFMMNEYNFYHPVYDEKIIENIKNIITRQ